MKEMREELERLVEEVRLELNDERFYVQAETILKNNVERQGIIITSEEGVSPIIYVDSFLEKIQNGFILASKAAQEILAIRFDEAEKEIQYAKFAMENITKEYVLSKVVRKLIGKEKNREFLESLPHEEICDLAITYYVVNRGENGVTSMAIKNSFIEHLEITKEELKKAAIKNEAEKYEYTVQNMREVMIEMFGEEFVQENDDAESNIMYVASNKEKHFGATAILHEDILERIIGKIKGDFYILPSSIHEVIAKSVEKDNQEEVDMLRDMVTEINETQVEPEEVLTDNVYICRVPKDGIKDISIEIA